MQKHIVVIEDHADTLEIITLTLRSAGYRVTPLVYMESVEQLIDLKPDLYIIDEILPGTSGHIICIILKSKPLTSRIPVLLISADQRLAHVASLCNADHYLLKPFDAIREIPSLIEKLLTGFYTV